jgi:dTDP-4-amino-4,6-dideoxygalactose transaminase
MLISKKPEFTDNLRNRHYFFENARSGFFNILRFLDLSAGETLLLPSYIGWSSKEGSGIFDPVKTSSVKYSFYPLKEDLSIDFLALQSMLDQNVKACLLVNYFGFPDLNYFRICNMLRKKHIIIIEDQAHSLFTHFVSRLSGKLSDFSIFSIHKMLPYHDGGMVILHNNDKGFAEQYNSFCATGTYEKSIFEYDFYDISKIRQKNYQFLESKLKGNISGIKPLFESLPAGVIPQTLPALVKNNRRDDLYFGLNDAGFGAVSLYHTLIDEIGKDQFPQAYFVSRNIINLPVHQDVSSAYLEKMTATIERILE